MRRPTIFLMLAVAAAFAAAVIVFSALKRREAEVQKAMARNVEIVVAAHDIELGEKLAPETVKLARWSRESVPEGVFTDPMAVVNSYAKGEFVAGEPIVQKKLVSAEKAAGVMPIIIPPGMRAMAVPVDEVSDIAGFVKPHTRVDVLVALSSTGSEGKPFSKIVLQNVEVLAVAQQMEKAGDEPEIVKVVTLLVTPHQAEKLGLASREGTLRLAMRNYGDDKLVATSGTDISELLGTPVATMPAIKAQTAPTPAEAAARAQGGRASRPFSITIMRDGKNAQTVSFIAEMPPANAADPMKPAPKREWRSGADHIATGAAMASGAKPESTGEITRAAAGPPATSGAPAPDEAAYVPVPKRIELP